MQAATDLLRPLIRAAKAPGTKWQEINIQLDGHELHCGSRGHLYYARRDSYTAAADLAKKYFAKPDAAVWVDADRGFTNYLANRSKNFHEDFHKFMRARINQQIDGAYADYAASTSDPHYLKTQSQSFQMEGQQFQYRKVKGWNYVLIDELLQMEQLVLAHFKGSGNYQRIKLPDDYINLRVSAREMGVVPSREYGEVIRLITDKAKAHVQPMGLESHEGIGTLNVKDTPLRLAWKIKRSVRTEGGFEFMSATYVGVHKDDLLSVRGMIGGAEQKEATDIQSSGREICGLLGLEPVRLQGSVLWNAYNTGQQELLGEPYRNLRIQPARWDAKRKSNVSLFAEPSAFPALCRYFHAIDPERIDAYLDRENTAKVLVLNVHDPAFASAWKAFSDIALKTPDGNDIMLGKQVVNAGIETRGALKRPRLDRADLDKFRDFIGQGVAETAGKKPSAGFSFAIPPGRGGRR